VGVGYLNIMVGGVGFCVSEGGGGGGGGGGSRRRDPMAAATHTPCVLRLSVLFSLFFCSLILSGTPARKRERALQTCVSYT